ncbi:hypothetical protein S40285_10512 [Stachybotrys chlorohalonatus IBT 40285]|uniref:Uncharacterized protein n=1 Tax=Stachybotrys chlorohalonatus (strain IBT 40285) TaxID=1283841 RepID=A0A084QGI7_STAC4|nr:hypothetical protein S40285_10512 [Stachybotrys chlorohalonata IBT 40285]
MQLRYASLNLAAQFHSAAAARCPRAATTPAPRILSLGCCHCGNHFGREARASARIAHVGSQPNRGGPITFRHILVSTCDHAKQLPRQSHRPRQAPASAHLIRPIRTAEARPETVVIVQDPPNHGALGTVAQAWRAGTARRITPSFTLTASRKLWPAE